MGPVTLAGEASYGLGEGVATHSVRRSSMPAEFLHHVQTPSQHWQELKRNYPNYPELRRNYPYPYTSATAGARDCGQTPGTGNHRGSHLRAREDMKRPREMSASEIRFTELEQGSIPIVDDLRQCSGGLK